MKKWIPYGRQTINDADIAAVIDVLHSNFLTTGPKVAEFEERVAEYCGVAHGVAVSSGTAALHCAMHALGIGPGDEVIVPSITFAATSNSVLYQGGTPVFADVDPETLLISPDSVAAKVTPATRAIVGVDYAGQPCEWAELRTIANKHKLSIVADACHAIGATYMGQRVGALADMSVFSFHPVKHIATGEGGMVVTDNPTFDEKARAFRGHGITSDFSGREASGEWSYEMVELGFNYRLTDIQSALGISQMARLDNNLARRRAIAVAYAAAFEGTPIHPLTVRDDCEHAYHLYVVRVPDRDRCFAMLRDAGIGVNVHYIPVHYHPYYRKRLGTGKGMCPAAEDAYTEILSLPMYPDMTDTDIETIVSRTLQAVER